jgi:hypothetical protein
MAAFPAALRICLALACVLRAHAASGGVQVTMYNNSAFAGTGSASTSVLDKTWPSPGGTMTAEWLGSLTVATTGAYRFNCTFSNGYGLAWVDDHILCVHGMPAYAVNPAAIWIDLKAGTPVAIRMQLIHNETTAAGANVGASMVWAARNPDGTSGALGPLPASVLTPTLEPAEERMSSLQRSQYVPLLRQSDSEVIALTEESLAARHPCL